MLHGDQLTDQGCGELAVLQETGFTPRQGEGRSLGGGACSGLGVVRHGELRLERAVGLAERRKRAAQAGRMFALPNSCRHGNLLACPSHSFVCQ